MACDGSYTVVIVPLQNSLYSLDALRFFHWLKQLKALEREKDSLWMGLQVLEQTRLWYQHQLENISERHARPGTRDQEEEEGWSCALRCRVQRVNGSLGSLLSDTCGWSSLAPDERGGSDWGLRWNNATLTQEVSERNQQISLLELQKESLIEQHYGMHYV
ncbi:suppressor APC domain-containing protein 1 [Pygocentrus nattereri]|uniref:suppressor APC domain-containing protein 1 n=1 Tax=Pygocentrus nattereri TaxID=42514 RepID=UPI0008146F96|nr:suppressor APC domain-containing protein 1 [Pygocentrus nattereri]